MNQKELRDRRKRIMDYALKHQLTRRQVAKKFKVSLVTVSNAAAEFGIEFTDARDKEMDPKWLEVDWEMPLAEIARMMGVSRQRVYQVRKNLIEKELI